MWLWVKLRFLDKIATLFICVWLSNSAYGEEILHSLGFISQPLFSFRHFLKCFNALQIHTSSRNLFYLSTIRFSNNCFFTFSFTLASLQLCPVGGQVLPCFRELLYVVKLIEDRELLPCLPCLSLFYRGPRYGFYPFPESKFLFLDITFIARRWTNNVCFLLELSQWGTLVTDYYQPLCPSYLMIPILCSR